MQMEQAKMAARRASGNPAMALVSDGRSPKCFRRVMYPVSTNA